MNIISSHLNMKKKKKKSFILNHQNKIQPTNMNILKDSNFSKTQFFSYEPNNSTEP